MGVINHTHEFNCPFPPARIFNALIVDSSVLIPKLLPQFIKNVELIQGDGGAGAVEKANYIEDGKVKYVKHRIEELDKDNFVCKYSMIEGDPLGEKLESIGYEVKFEATSDGGSVCKMRSNYYTIGDHIITEEEIMSSQNKAMGIYKVVEAYLFQNPHAYA